jgi:putative transposase
MKRGRYSEEEKIRALQAAESGRAVVEVCRELGITEQCFYKWRRKYGGLEVREAKKLRQLEVENSQLKRIVAQQALDIEALKGLLGKKW